jgi:hypothetical protein
MRKLLIFAGIIVLALVVFAGLLAWTQRFPRFEKLAECNSPFLTFSLNCPPGDSFNFILVFQGITNLADLKCPAFAGRVEITNGQKEVFSNDLPQKTSFPFWLYQEKHIAGFVLIFPDDQNPFITKVVEPKTSYTVNITLSKQLPMEAELWLGWRQSRIDDFDYK